MSTDVGAILRELDFSIIQGSSSDAWLLRAPDGTSFEVSPAPPVSRLSAHTIRTLIAHHKGGSSPLLVGETATDGVLGRAEAGQVDLLIADPVRLIHAGIPTRFRRMPRLGQLVQPLAGMPGCAGRWSASSSWQQSR